MAFMKFSFLPSTGFVPSSICSSSYARVHNTHQLLCYPVVREFRAHVSACRRHLRHVNLNVAGTPLI